MLLKVKVFFTFFKVTEILPPVNISNTFSSENTWPIEAKFHVDTTWARGNESVLTGSGSPDRDGCHAHIY